MPFERRQDQVVRRGRAGLASLANIRTRGQPANFRMRNGPIRGLDGEYRLTWLCPPVGVGFPFSAGWDAMARNSHVRLSPSSNQQGAEPDLFWGSPARRDRRTGTEFALKDPSIHTEGAFFRCRR